MNAAAKSSVAWKRDSCKVVEWISLRYGRRGGHLCCVDGKTEAAKHFEDKKCQVPCAVMGLCTLSSC